MSINTDTSAIAQQSTVDLDISPIGKVDQQLEIVGAKDDLLSEVKLSMLSKPNKVVATVPDFNLNEKEIEALGLVRDTDGWHLPFPNREWFPDAIDEDQILIEYGTRSDGTKDIGFCTKEEFSRIYADTSQYDEGSINYIEAANLEKMQPVRATKHAVSEFALVPVGTVVHTNEGMVKIEPGQVLIINESTNSVYASSLKEVFKRYVGDPMNPASGEMFDAFESYIKASSEGEVDFNQLIERFYSVDRTRRHYFGDNPESLGEVFRNTAELVDGLESTIGNRMDALSFDERLQQADEIIEEIINSETLTATEKNTAVQYVMVRLLPKTNNHQHLKGSVPMNTMLMLAERHGFSGEEITQIKDAYQKGMIGFEHLDEFNSSYGVIGRAVRTPGDYQEAILSIMQEATRSSQLSVEIRCSVIGQRDESGNELSPEVATENMISAMDQALEAIGDDAPAVSFVFLGYRGRDWKPEEVIDHARLAVEFAKKYPNRKFGFDIAGPEDTGYSPKFFSEAYEMLREYNEQIDAGLIVGERIGVTTHAGETPTFDNGRPGHEAVIEAIEMGVDRIGHGVQAVGDAETLEALKQSGKTVEICGVCNITSIPINTKGMAIHPIQQFLSNETPVTICTDNDAICGTSITKEYAMFLLSGHSELMNWKNVKKVAQIGLDSSFISQADRELATDKMKKRVRTIERMAERAVTRIKENSALKTGSGILSIAT